MCKHIFWYFFENFSVLAGGRCPPDPPVFGWGGAKPPQTPPLNGRSSHLIEAAKRGRLDQMIFFSAPLTTRAPPGRPAGRPAERPAERLAARPTQKSLQAVRIKPETKYKRSYALVSFYYFSPWELYFSLVALTFDLW